MSPEHRVDGHAAPTTGPALDDGQVAATAASIIGHQEPDGLILWFDDGHADVWNHVEAAMALDVAGCHTEAARAYQWLLDRQHDDGWWHHYYVAGGVEDAKIDTNCCAYVATGAYHHWLVTGDSGFLDDAWPMVERAIDFVLELQTPRGEVIWARHEDGTPWSYALLTGSSSIHHSLRCATALATAVGAERADWELAALRLAAVIAGEPDAFEPKHRWAMDWYYPVLTGALTGGAAVEHLESGRSTFVMDGVGVRCVSDRDWVTAAETCECVMAHLAVGDVDTARRLFGWVEPFRTPDGAYYTGIAYPDEVHFPADERTTYTAAAVLLAADALDGRTPASGLFLAPEHP